MKYTVEQFVKDYDAGKYKIKPEHQIKETWQMKYFLPAEPMKKSTAVLIIIISIFVFLSFIFIGLI